MKRAFIIAIAAALAAAAWASPPRYEFRGGWGYFSHWLNGEGSFVLPHGVAVASNGNVYVADWYTGLVQYFIPPQGTHLGQWGGGTGGLDISPGGYVYVADYRKNAIHYFTLSGSLVGSWGQLGTGNGRFRDPIDVEVGPKNRVYVIDRDNDRVQYFTSTGSFLGKWGKRGTGNGEFTRPEGVGIAASGNVYVADSGNNRIQYFTPTGSFLGKWGGMGTKNGKFNMPMGVEVTKGGIVFVADHQNRRVQYFTRGGSFLGKFGSEAHELQGPADVALSPSELWVYVVDMGNCCIRCYVQTNVTVAPASLGSVKALFK